MKINYKHLLPFLLALGFFPCLQAQVTVVKQDGQNIYLDISEYTRTVSVGDTFQVILSKEKLTNPKTGKDLGWVNHYSETGTITEAQPMYVVGQIPGKQVVKVGQDAVITAAAEPVQTSAANTNVAEQETPVAAPVSNRKAIAYNVVDQEIISAAKADFTLFPGEEIAALTAKKVILYQTEGLLLQPLSEFKLPISYEPITLSVQDLMQTGTPQIFVTVYDDGAHKISTLVFELKDNELKQVASVPYFVKQWGCGDEQKIYAQKPFISNIKPGDAHLLQYVNGRFKLDKKGFNTRHNWLSGTQVFPIENAESENLLYTASSGRLKMQLDNGKFIESEPLFSATPNRVKYKQQLVYFYPAVEIYKENEKATIAAIENTTKMGILSEQFGLYNGAKLHFLTYENGTLKTNETAVLDGFVYDMNCTQKGILVPQVLASGQTILKEIYR